MYQVGRFLRICANREGGSGLLMGLLRWRWHLAATVGLLLVLAVSAAGGVVPRRTNLRAAADGAGSSADAALVGGDQGSVAGQTGAAAGPGQAAEASGTAAAGRAAGLSRGLSGAPAGPKVTYDDGADDNQVVIGGSTFTSGPAAVYGQQIAVGFAAGVNYVNDHGGINGRRLVAKIYDDGADPAKQLANTKRLVEVDHAFALTMSYAPVAGAYVAQKGIPVFHLGQFNEEFTNPWWFPLGGPQKTAAMQLAHFGSRTLGAKKVAIFYLDAGANNFSGAFARDVSRYWKAYGVDASTLVPFAPDQTSCSNAISTARNAGVDFVDFEIDAGHVIQCGVEAQIQGWKPAKSWGGYLIGVPVIHEALGDYSLGMYAFDAFGANYDNPDYNAYIKKVSSSTDAYSSTTISYFIAALLARDSMDKLGATFTRAHLREVLNTFKAWRPGLTSDANQPDWTWTPTCHVALHGGYVIEVKKQPNGSLRWDQITPQLQTTPLPPGEGPPPDLASCPIFAPG
jgi:ABC-type branched-subunit amino acid transport system substrate-binding protein